MSHYKSSGSTVPGLCGLTATARCVKLPEALLVAPPGPLTGLCNVESADPYWKVDSCFVFGLRFSLRPASKAFGGATAAAHSDADAGAAAAAYLDADALRRAV